MTDASSATREEEEEGHNREAHRRTRRERHERHRRERKDRRHKDSHSESDTTEDEAPKLLEPQSHAPLSTSLPGPEERERARKRTSFADEPLMTGALGTGEGLGSLRENVEEKGTYMGYMRHPPPGVVNAGLGGGMSSSLPSPALTGERKGVKF